ncbi:hypothetical protein O6H91_11G051300 [Diphasiastrum complanatum]|uniref:Uncharacterized protein n=3 Tax=Diphasiastrum complanatum TaxID=34168 RepID=A0ACC2CA35_DIPCM|nr:hypothetical protein O6H91_11G051300 [Diphasiastrum complanatum]
MGMADTGVLPQWLQQLDWRLLVCVAVGAILVMEQMSYKRRGQHLPGPALVLPFFGNVVSMVRDPAKFWDDQARAARKCGLSWNVVFGRFVVFVRDSELSQKIFANVKPEVFHLIGHPFGKKLFGEKNLIFMFGEAHKDLRRRLAPLFTLKALGVYVSIQENTIRKHIIRWLEMAKNPEPVQLRLLCREMNLETSQNVFVGPYLSASARAQITRDYYLFNVGLMRLPVYLPGFSFYKATHAVQRLIRTLGDCASQSKQRMREGHEPTCLMDFWMVETLREMKEAEQAGSPPPPHSSDMEIGQHVFDFLFAAQDASTSSLVWVATLLEQNPKVLEKIREEQRQIRCDPNSPITPEQLREMKYTEMVVKEVLRFRPPATMVPHIANVDFPLTDSYVVPKGAIIFPSLLESSFQGFSNPHTFDPERFSPDRVEDQVYKRNWLLFGAGPHQCLGQRYAINHLILFTALFCRLASWTRIRTPGCDEIMYTPTIVPKDGCLIYLSARHDEE